MNTPLTPFTGDSMPRRRQWLYAGLGTLLIGTIAACAYFALRPGYQVLFRDLKPRDASAIVAELDKQKVPYRYDEPTGAILVPEDDARATRVKLLSGDLKLSGLVGLELFNNSDLGLTDFAQKVNYQRALQGELARTIMTLDEVELARVHLALPEATLFRREQVSPKASVAVFVRDGETLTPATVLGIQRLVAASVPEMKPSDVTILDNRGASSSEAALPADVDDPRFALRRAIEDRLERKITDVLDAVPGVGHAAVSVTADIDYDQSRITRETDTASHDTTAASDASAHPVLPPLPAGGIASNTAAPAAVPGHRTLEQIVGAPGAIRRLSVGVVLTTDTTAAQRDNLRAVVSAAIGLDAKRGDVLTIAPFAAPPAHPAPPLSAPVSRVLPMAAPKAVPTSGIGTAAWVPVVVIAAFITLAAAALILFRRPRAPASPARLSETERSALASRLRLLLEEEASDHAVH
jgi:flagellar M-ring protein FliF